jgi:hypothetical protein
MKNAPSIALETMLDLPHLPAIQIAWFIQTQYGGLGKVPENV